MNGTITGGTTPVTPTLIIGLEEDAPGGAIVHKILGRADPDVTLRPAGTRAGRLELAFAGTNADAASDAAVASLRSAAVFRLTADRSTMNMTFVVPDTGRVSRRIEEATRNAFTVLVDYQEVLT